MTLKQRRLLMQARQSPSLIGMQINDDYLHSWIITDIDYVNGETWIQLYRLDHSSNIWVTYESIESYL